MYNCINSFVQVFTFKNRFLTMNHFGHVEWFFFLILWTRTLRLSVRSHMEDFYVSAFNWGSLLLWPSKDPVTNIQAANHKEKTFEQIESSNVPFEEIPRWKCLWQSRRIISLLLWSPPEMKALKRIWTDAVNTWRDIWRDFASPLWVPGFSWELPFVNVNSSFFLKESLVNV